MTQAVGEGVEWAWSYKGCALKHPVAAPGDVARSGAVRLLFARESGGEWRRVYRPTRVAGASRWAEARRKKKEGACAIVD